MELANRRVQGDASPPHRFDVAVGETKVVTDASSCPYRRNGVSLFREMGLQIGVRLGSGQIGQPELTPLLGFRRMEAVTKH
jgi:hypothetical protein